MAGSAHAETLVPAWFVCRQLEITKQTFGHWVTSGKVPVAGRDSRNRPLYRYVDAALAERRTRRSGKSRRGCRHHEPAPA